MSYPGYVGIPNPSTALGFSIDLATPSWPASWLTGTTTATANYFYVDKTDPAATDSGNPFGHPDLPRLTIPEGDVTAAILIYIHAGTYNSSGDRFNWVGAGTAMAPVFISGNAAVPPTLADKVHVGSGGGNTAYFVIENVKNPYPEPWEFRPDNDAETINHILIRRVNRYGTNSLADHGGFAIGLSGSDSLPNILVSNIVFYQCNIHDLGVLTSDESDFDGVNNGFHTLNVFVLECVFNEISADAIGGGHNSDGITKITDGYFVAGCTFGRCGENGVDTKTIQNIVISQNDFVGPYDGREQGWAAVCHSGANPQPTKNVWFLNNKFARASAGIVCTSTNGVDGFNAMGNTFYDINESYGIVPQAINGTPIGILIPVGIARIICNTFVKYQAGVSFTNLGSTEVSMCGNIFWNRTDALRYEIAFDSSGDQDQLDSNYNSFPLSARFKVDGAARTFAYWQGIGQDAGSFQGDPYLTNEATEDFYLLADSPCINAVTDDALIEEACDAFFLSFGLDIRKDMEGVTRPQGPKWDIGALEYAGTPNVGAPPNFRLLPNDPL